MKKYKKIVLNHYIACFKNLKKIKLEIVSEEVLFHDSIYKPHNLFSLRY